MPTPPATRLVPRIPTNPVTHHATPMRGATQILGTLGTLATLAMLVTVATLTRAAT